MNLMKWMYAVPALLIAQGAFAQDVTIIGALQHQLKQSEQEAFYTNKRNPIDEIQLLEVELSDEAKDVLIKRAQDALTHSNQFSSPLPDSRIMPPKMQLGMNKVPVLNQGKHGTCVTFALTAAVDALIGRKDYVSQLCQLQLGSYLQKQGNGKSNWNGGYPLDVLNQMEKYGITNKSKQHSVGCGGYYHYPTNSSHADNSYMELAKFQEIAEPFFGSRATWSEIPTTISYNSAPEQALQAVKQALNAGDRVVFASLLPRTDLGNSGAVGKHETWFAKDSWVLTPEILADIQNTDAAHAMVIIGYDDNAVATDNHGVKHKGLLTLRNSWSWWYGNWGEFYMSYDYFKMLAFDAKQISATKYKRV